MTFAIALGVVLLLSGGYLFWQWYTDDLFKEIDE